MKYSTRLQLRAIKHGLILIWSGISGREKKIGEYISVHDDPDDFHIEHFGKEYPNSIIYSIGEAGKGYGFCAELRTLLEHLDFAEHYGFISHVKYGKNYLYYDHSLEEKYDSAFEYFFEPIGNSINIQEAQNVLFSKPGYAEKFLLDHGSDSSHFDASAINRLAELYRKYISIHHEIEDKIIQEFAKINKHKSKILGVHYRGTDYKCGYDGHPQMQILDETIKISSRLLDEEFDLIFLATDDSEALGKFQDAFGERVVAFDDVIRSAGKKSVAFSESDRPFHKYKLAYEVLRDAYCLSICDGLIAGLSQVSLISRIMKLARENEYRKLVIMDNGINHNFNKFKV